MVDQYLTNLSFGELSAKLDKVDVIMPVLSKDLHPAYEVVREPDLSDTVQFAGSFGVV